MFKALRNFFAEPPCSICSSAFMDAVYNQCGIEEYSEFCGYRLRQHNKGGASVCELRTNTGKAWWREELIAAVEFNPYDAGETKWICAPEGIDLIKIKLAV